MNNMSSDESSGWEVVIRRFLYEKRESDEEKYLKEVIKHVKVEFSKTQWVDDEEIQVLFNPRKNKKGDHQTRVEFQRQLYTQAKALTTQYEELDWNKFDERYQKKISELDKKYSPRVWITQNAPYASEISYGSHIAKLTHSKISMTCQALEDGIGTVKPGLLTTSSLREIVIDAYVNNRHSPVYQFLELKFEGRKLADEIRNEESVALESFAINRAELREWNAAFKKATMPGDLSSHTLLKQVYFPITTYKNEDEEEPSYHLLTNLTSSSMAQAIFNRLFSKQHAQAKKQCDKGKYSSDARVNYSRRAKISVTASNPGNASQLNGRRDGKLHLLSAQPPTWKRQLLPPVRMKSWFDYGIPNHAVHQDINYLREFLLRFERLELSARGPERRKWIEKWGTSIVDEVLFLAGTIQAMPAGWSDDPTIKLKEEHQYFLDPYREDEFFISRRESSDWQLVVCNDFATWLNRQLIGVDKNFTPQEEHTKLWANLIAPELRELGESLKAGRREATVVSEEENS